MLHFEPAFFSDDERANRIRVAEWQCGTVIRSTPYRLIFRNAIIQIFIFQLSKESLINAQDCRDVIRWYIL